MVEEIAEESKEELVGGARAAPKEPTGEIPGHEECAVAGRGNSYTEKG